MQIPSDTALTYGRGYVYRIQYHIVWCVKYRKQILTGDIEIVLKEEISRHGMHARPCSSVNTLYSAALHSHHN